MAMRPDEGLRNVGIAGIKEGGDGIVESKVYL